MSHEFHTTISLRLESGGDLCKLALPLTWATNCWSTTFQLTFFPELVNSSMQFSWSQWRTIFLRLPMKNVANNNEINEQLDTQQQQKQKKMNAKRMKRKNSHIFSVFALEHVIYCKQEPWQHFFRSAHSTYLYHRKRAVMKTMYAVGLWLVKCKSHW